MEQIVNMVMEYAPVPVLITAVYALLIYRQLSKELKIFSYFLFLSGAVELISKMLWFKSKNNLPLLHFYVAAGFVCLAWFYSTVLNDFMDKKIIWGTAVLFLLFTTLNSLFVQNIFTFNSYALTVESVLIIILSLSTFMLLLNDIVRETRTHQVKSLNWINSGLFLYYSSSLLIFYFGEVITHTFSKNLNRYTWVLHSFFSVVMYSCFFVGLWKRPRS